MLLFIPKGRLDVYKPEMRTPEFTTLTKRSHPRTGQVTLRNFF